MYLSCLELRFSYVQIANLTGQFPGTNGGHLSNIKPEKELVQEKKQEMRSPGRKNDRTEVDTYRGTYSVY